MKRIRYECEKCGAEHDVRFHSWEIHPRRMNCKACLEKNAMAAKMPSPANHYRPTRSKR